MFGRRNLEKRKLIFQNMPARYLRRYCDRHHHDLLSFEIMNTRFDQALQTMHHCAQKLPEKSRSDLATYAKILLIDDKMTKQPYSLQEIYTPLLEENSPQKQELENALNEFSAFVLSPIGKTAKRKLRRLVLSISPISAMQESGNSTTTQNICPSVNETKTEFLGDLEKDIERYKPQTCYLPHPALTYSD